MPVTTDSFLWEATGFFSSGTSQTVVATHPDAGGTTAGSTVLVALVVNAAPTVTKPTGFGPIATGVGLQAYTKSQVAAAETSWSFTVGAATGTWYMAEFDGDVAVEDPFDGAGASATATVSNGGTATGAPATNAGSSGVALAFFSAAKVGTTDVQSWSGWTNSFAERADVSPASGSTAGRTLGVAWRSYDGWSTWGTAATFATSAASASTNTRVVLLRSAEASINAPLAFFTTFGFGTHAGMGASAFGAVASMLSPLGMGGTFGGGLQTFPVGTWGTNYSVGAYGRDGRTGLEISAAAATVNVRIPPIFGTGGMSFGANVKAVSGSGTPTAAQFIGTSPGLSLLYDVTNEKFGLQWEGGSPVWQTGTTPTGSFAWVDIKARVNSDIWHADWSIETGTGDGTQTSPADLTGMGTATNAASLGSLSSQTGVFRYSDVVASTYPAAYPLGPHIVRVLAPETTGATVSGTAGNFNRFTANGTLAAVSGTEGALLDDIPPTISASSDGVVQVTLAASDYLNMPMTTYTLAADEIIAGVRAFASLWGGTGSATGTLGFRGHDGTTETTFVTAGTSFDPDSLTTASATYPMWYSAMWGVGSAWNQTKLNAAALRGGFSTDATPDMGFSCMGLEVSIKTVTPVTLLRVGENDEFTVEAYVNPYHSGTVALQVVNSDPTLTASMTYSVSGVPQAPVTATPGNSTTVDIHADAFGDISDVKLTSS